MNYYEFDTFDANEMIQFGLYLSKKTGMNYITYADLSNFIDEYIKPKRQKELRIKKYDRIIKWLN